MSKASMLMPVITHRVPGIDSNQQNADNPIYVEYVPIY
jgi:hypothetical protein